MLPDVPLIVLAAPAFVLAIYAIRLTFSRIGQPEFSQRALLNKGETRLFMMLRDDAMAVVAAVELQGSGHWGLFKL